MADAAPTTTPATNTSTPAAETVAAAPATTAKTAEPSTTTQPSTTPVTESPKPVETTVAKQDATPVTEPAKTEPAKTEPTGPLFTLPTDLKLDDGAKATFEAFVKSKLQPDGKLSLTAQEVVDTYVAQARDAYTRWQKQIQDTDKANADTCKARFTPAQLAQSETAVGFFSSYDPQFREFAKSQLNSPVFVNAMRLVGERLSEDSFEPAGNQPATPARRTPAERMGYVKAKSN
jgi:hypothetical protein